MVRTSKYVEQFDSDNAIQKYPVNDYVTMAKMLAMRRLDAGIGSSLGLFYGAYMAGVKPEEIGVPLVLGSNDFILFVSKKTAQPETAAGHSKRRSRNSRPAADQADHEQVQQVIQRQSAGQIAPAPMRTVRVLPRAAQGAIYLGKLTLNGLAVLAHDLLISPLAENFLTVPRHFIIFSWSKGKLPLATPISSTAPAMYTP